MGKKKVLVIEDEPEIRVILAKSLQHYGHFEVITAENGLNGVEIAQRERPSLILLDALMPGLDGYDTCTKIKEIPELKNTPVVFLTAKTDSNAYEEALSAGASECLAKPFDPLTLGERISAIIDGVDRK